MKIIITDDMVIVEDADFEIDHENKIDWSCRLASHEAVAWGIKRMGEELEKSVSFYRTGESVDSIGMD